jgi:hypothetical protein
MLTQNLKEDLIKIIEYIPLDAAVKRGARATQSPSSAYRRRRSEEGYWGSQKRAPSSVRSYQQKVTQQKQALRKAQNAGEAPQSYIRWGSYSAD